MYLNYRNFNKFVIRITFATTSSTIKFKKGYFKSIIVKGKGSGGVGPITIINKVVRGKKVLTPKDPTKYKVKLNKNASKLEEYAESKGIETNGDFDQIYTVSDVSNEQGNFDYSFFTEVNDFENYNLVETYFVSGSFVGFNATTISDIGLFKGKTPRFSAVKSDVVDILKDHNGDLTENVLGGVSNDVVTTLNHSCSLKVFEHNKTSHRYSVLDSVTSDKRGSGLVQHKLYTLQHHIKEIDGVLKKGHYLKRCDDVSVFINSEFVKTYSPVVDYAFRGIKGFSDNVKSSRASSPIIIDERYLPLSTIIQKVRLKTAYYKEHTYNSGTKFFTPEENWIIVDIDEASLILDSALGKLGTKQVLNSMEELMLFNGLNHNSIFLDRDNVNLSVLFKELSVENIQIKPGYFLAPVDYNSFLLSVVDTGENNNQIFLDKGYERKVHKLRDSSYNAEEDSASFQFIAKSWNNIKNSKLD